jgi:hypothetical protein
MRVGDEHVRQLGDRGDAVDQVEDASHSQEDRRGYDQATAAAFLPRPWLA